MQVALPGFYVMRNPKPQVQLVTLSTFHPVSAALPPLLLPAQPPLAAPTPPPIFDHGPFPRFRIPLPDIIRSTQPVSFTSYEEDTKD